MQLPSTASTVEVDGSFDSADFQLDVNQHAFSILSSGLYSDRYLAIVRELCCNAWDAHVAAGTTDKKFELYLPNDLAPVFKVRDYGTGLSEQEILDVYRVYFKSTKQKSDAMTGCFGLGSKTPYAYAKKFTIISYYHGTKFHYAAVIGENGLPRIVKMAETETDEHNGMEISFAVDSDDFYDFKVAAEKALRPFAEKPIVKGIAHFEPKGYGNVILSGKGWSILENVNEKLVVMGNVEYPVSAQRSFSSNAKNVLALGIVFEMPLGSFVMTPSRESIKWVDFSEKNINDRLEQIYDEVCDLLSEKIQGATTLWDARTTANELVLSTRLKKLSPILVWNGHALEAEVDISKVQGVRVTRILATPKKRYSAAGVNSASLTGTTNISTRPTTFYLKDFPGGDGRVSNHVRDNFKRDQYCYLISAQSDADLQVLLDTLGLSKDRLLLASDVPKRAHVGGGGGGHASSLAGSKSKVFSLIYSGESSMDTHWEELDLDFDEPDLGVYVEISRWRPINTIRGEDHPKEIRKVMNILTSMGAEVPDGGVVGIKTAHAKKMKERPNWVHFDSFVREQLQKIWESDDKFRVAVELFAPQNLGGNGEVSQIKKVRELVEEARKRNFLPKDSFLCKFAEAFDPYFKLEGQAHDFHRLSWYFDRKIEEEHYPMSLVYPHREKGPQYASRLYSRYPLLYPLLRCEDYEFSYDHLDYRKRKSAKAKAISEYVLGVDASLSSVKSSS